MQCVETQLHSKGLPGSGIEASLACLLNRFGDIAKANTKATAAGIEQCCFQRLLATTCTSSAMLQACGLRSPFAGMTSLGSQSKALLSTAKVSLGITSWVSWAPRFTRHHGIACRSQLTKEEMICSPLRQARPKVHQCQHRVPLIKQFQVCQLWRGWACEPSASFASYAST